MALVGSVALLVSMTRNNLLLIAPVYNMPPRPVTFLQITLSHFLSLSSLSLSLFVSVSFRLLITRYQDMNMNGVLGHDSTLQGYTGPVTTWANEMHFVMNHAPGAPLPRNIYVGGRKKKEEAGYGSNDLIVQVYQQERCFRI